MDISKHSAIKYILILLILVVHQAVLADEPVKNNNTYLEVARTQLSMAYDNYNKGEIDAAKENLQHASKWLNMAVEHSPSDSVKSEAKKLADKINNFRSKLNESPEKNELVRFWHEVTSLMRRESEHLVHSYIEQSTLNKILKHVLDAKMHFHTAEHDLFVSHESNAVTLELERSLEYLAEAKSIATPELKANIVKLIAGIQELKSLSAQNKDAWKKDAMIHSLDNALDNLSSAESVASPPARMKIESIKEAILKLEEDTQITSLKVKYDSIMSDFYQTIRNID